MQNFIVVICVGGIFVGIFVSIDLFLHFPTHVTRTLSFSGRGYVYLVMMTLALRGCIPLPLRQETWIVRLLHWERLHDVLAVNVARPRPYVSARVQSRRWKRRKVERIGLRFALLWFGTHVGVKPAPNEVQDIGGEGDPQRLFVPRGSQHTYLLRKHICTVVTEGIDNHGHHLGGLVDEFAASKFAVVRIAHVLDLLDVLDPQRHVHSGVALVRRQLEEEVSAQRRRTMVSRLIADLHQGAVSRCNPREYGLTNDFDHSSGILTAL